MSEECCKRCCYSTPYWTLFALSVVIVGLVGFVAAGIYAVVIVGLNTELNRHVVVFAPILGGILLVSVVPLLLATIMGYCVTGYIRDELYSNMAKRCIGPQCSFFVMICNFLYFLFWLLVAVGLGALMAVFIELRLTCDHISSTGQLGSNSTCLPPFTDNITETIGFSPVCGAAQENLCIAGQNVGLAFVVALGFSVVIIIGLVLMLMIQMGNYVNARENMEYRRSYQPRTNGSTSDEDYAMKRVR